MLTFRFIFNYGIKFISKLAILLSLVALPSMAIAQGGIDVFVRLVIKRASTDGARIIVKKNDVEVEKQQVSRRGRFDVRLDYDADYMLSFEKEGYVTKTININTNVSNEDGKRFRNIIDFEVELELQTNTSAIKVYDNPVARIRFDDRKGDFGVDVDYSASFREAVAAEEKKIAEEAQRAQIEKHPKEDKTLALAETHDMEEALKRAAEEKQKEDEKIRLANEARQKAEEEARLAEQERIRKEAEQARLAQEAIRKAEEDARRLAELEARQREEERIRQEEMRRLKAERRKLGEEARLAEQKRAWLGAEFKFIYFENSVMCRSLPMSHHFQKNNPNYVDDVVFFFNDDKKISSLSLGLDQLALADIIDRNVLSERARMVLVNFLENYKTAYALKHADYIESIFAHNALIIVGSVLKNKTFDDNPYLENQIIEYNRYTKEQFIQNLSHSFTSNEVINICFENNIIRKSGRGGEIYGIQIKQDYFSSNYEDSGYLFLLVDINDPDQPIIHARTWQPEKNPDGSIYGLSDF